MTNCMLHCYVLCYMQVKDISSVVLLYYFVLVFDVLMCFEPLLLFVVFV
jgi:hypothetical protein